MCDCMSCVRDLGVCLVKDFFDFEEPSEQNAQDATESIPLGE